MEKKKIDWKFEVGKRYEATSLVDSFEKRFTCIKRTARTATFRQENGMNAGMVVKRTLRVFTSVSGRSHEWTYPLGEYAFAPKLHATSCFA